MGEPDLPPVPHLYPSLGMSDLQWEHVLNALRKTGTKRDAAIAKELNRQIQRYRRRHAERERDRA